MYEIKCTIGRNVVDDRTEYCARSNEQRKLKTERLSVGLMVSRLFSGRMVDKGWLTQIIAFGMVVTAVSYFALSFLEDVMGASLNAGSILFLLIALLTGVGFGAMFPAYSTLFVVLARHDQMGTAPSTL